MAVYERTVRVAAPLEEVWDFHSRVTGLTALTPDWFNLEIESVTGPDGEPDPDVLVEGSRIVASVRPFGVGPRQQWTSEIVARTEGDGRASFRDRMVDGPFAAWEHTHTFRERGDATAVRDRVECELPGGGLGRLVSPVATVGLAPTFRYRHRRTRELLE
ncbi:MAG: SRPBCC family protein [Halorientalis sp.]